MLFRSDDLVDTGGTYVKLLPELHQRYPHFTQIKTAVLWTKAASSFTPDYSVEFLPTSPWIHQPFEEYDTLRPHQLGSRK